jgi:uncharacterized protein (TIGR00369 family)
MDEWNAGLMRHLGMRFVEVGPERVVAEIEVGEQLTTVGGAVHGGTLMALADTVGAAGTAAAGFTAAGCAAAELLSSAQAVPPMSAVTTRALK